VASAIKKITILLTLIVLLPEPETLFALGKKEGQTPTLQEKYNALTVPGIIMLPVSGTSSVSPDVLTQIERELLVQLINDNKIKPVRMHRWLLSTYVNKANNPFVIMNAIREEQYAFPLQYIGKPFVFKNGNHYYFVLYVYFLQTYYPITVFRQLTSLNSVEDMISSCIEELNVRVSQPASGGARKRIIIDDFKLDFYRLAKHSSGEFDFISTPFLERDGMTMREGDDYFSRTMGYILETTNLFQVIQIGDFKEYSNANIGANSNLADYRIQGRVQLSDYECILYIDVIDIRSSVRVLTLRHPLRSYSFDILWNAYRQLSVQIVEKLFNSETYGVIPALIASNKSFFSNNMFVGWNKLENYILGKGLHVISTGTQFWIENSKPSENSYYVILDDQIAVFYGMEGKRIWNLLKK
jgi:hypothetical protein